MASFVRLLLVVTALGACAAPQATSAVSGTAAAPPANEQIYVATDTGISVVAQSGAVARELPRGVSSPDWSAFYAVEPGSTTVLHVLDATTGVERASINVPGRFDLGSAYRVAPSGLSRNGAFLTLEAAPTSTASSFAVVDLKSGVVKTISVPGAMTVDVVSDDGASLYLVEHRPDNRYNVRLFDLTTGRLAEKPIVDLKQIELSTPDSVTRGLMAGVFQASVDGTLNAWHFSLYFNPGRRPFIHALNVNARYATCILDLPVGPGPASPGFWTVALTPNGKSLYAANAIEGTVTKYDADTLQAVAWKPLSRGAKATTASIDATTASVIAY